MNSTLILLQLKQILTLVSFLILYVWGMLIDGQNVVHVLHMQTPQLRQCPALLNMAKSLEQMKQVGVFEKGTILGGALAMAYSCACRSVGKEKALRYFDAASGLVGTPF